MRQIKRNISAERPRLALRRSADGRLRPASEEGDIADIWAEQKRIQLKQAIDTQKRREAKKQGPREFEIRLSLPKFKRPSLDDFEDFLGHVHLPRIRRGHLAAIGFVVLMAAVIGSAFWLRAQHDPKPKVASHVSSSVLGASGQSQKPDFDTILPAGKTIQDLGGWGRVSPPDKDPVYGFADTLSGVHIVVSEQPLPDDFRSDIPGQLNKVAKQFNAGTKLQTTDGNTIYINTAGTGGQSLVTAKHDLLILIRASGTVSNQLWIDYVDLLQ